MLKKRGGGGGFETSGILSRLIGQVRQAGDDHKMKKKRMRKERERQELWKQR